MAAQTLFDKIWESHVVRAEPDGTTLLYIDRQLVHEVTSPQAFEGLKLSGRRPRRPGATLAVPDHNVPTTDRTLGIADPLSAKQIQTLEENCRDFGITLFGMNDIRQGVVHVIGPEQGFTLPGTTIVCGDSHTSTHGAFGALAFGIGTSEVEHVLATQCLVQKRPKTMEVRVDGSAVDSLFGKGRHSRDHRKDRHSRRNRLCHRVHGLGDPRPQHGRAHDALQHVDRGRRTRRDGRTGREHHRLYQRTSVGSEGRAVRAGRASMAAAQDRCERDIRYDRHDAGRGHRAASQLGHESRDGDRNRSTSAGPAYDHRREPAPGYCAGIGIHGPHPEHAHDRYQDRYGVHRVLHQFTHRGPPPCSQAWPRASMSPRPFRRWSCPVPVS